jgi:hypothetical protein
VGILFFNIFFCGDPTPIPTAGMAGSTPNSQWDWCGTHILPGGRQLVEGIVL